MNNELKIYNELLQDIKIRIRQGQTKAMQSANAEMLATYWDIGKIIHHQQQLKGWGAGVIPKLALDLKNELADIKGYSERNLYFMVQFYKEYSSDHLIMKPPVSKLETNEIKDQLINENHNPAIVKLSVSEIEKNGNYILISKISWAHHIILTQKIKNLPIRYWYMQKIATENWSRDTLVAQIKNNAHQRQGALTHNFENTMSAAQATKAQHTFKDPYIFDFLTLSTEFTENELELQLVKHVQQFLLELGAGFAFVGRQYKISISDKDFYIDLLFYHLTMRCFVVVELKNGDFMPEYAGKINFYCSAIDDQLKHPTDAPTIGLILCKGKDKLFAEYALRDIHKPIGISQYELTQMLPENLKTSLPSIEEIENEFLTPKTT